MIDKKAVHKIYIVDTTTNVAKIVNFSTVAWHEASLFNWQENNYSCDCNRDLVFSEGSKEVDEVECSNSKFYIWKVIDELGIEHLIDEPNLELNKLFDSLN